VRYQEVSDDEWRSETLARGVNQHAVEHLSQLWRSFRAASLRPDFAGFEVTDTIEKLGGAKPKTLEEFVREEQSALTAEPKTEARLRRSLKSRIFGKMDNTQ
jgi:hypothetical protein